MSLRPHLGLALVLGWGSEWIKTLYAHTVINKLSGSKIKRFMEKITGNHTWPIYVNLVRLM
jgi:hypothetical protein